MKKDICVIGTGRFGLAIIDQLSKMKQYSILAIDKNEATLSSVSQIVTSVAIADAADLRALSGLGVANFDTVIVALSDNIEVIAALLELNVKNIIARANSKRHARVLKQIGVDVIIRPEEEAGIRTALIATNQSFIKYSEHLQEVGDGYVIGSIILSNSQISDKPLKDVNFNNKGVSVVLVKRGVSSVLPSGNLTLKLGDIITVIGLVQNVTNVFTLISTDNEKTTKVILRKRREFSIFGKKNKEKTENAFKAQDNGLISKTNKTTELISTKNKIVASKIKPKNTQ
ncbi:potassium channel family protein [[Mycoplasma] mobile]|nr:TrkA family potassium uptake protein [[Mycoplasma] mobile]